MPVTRPTFAIAVLTITLAACGSANGDGTRASTEAATEPAERTSTDAGAPTGTTTTPPAQAQSAARLRLTKVGTFDQPLYVTGAPGDRRRVFVVEQGGRIMVVRGGRKLKTPFLDIRSLVTSGGEQGLLSVAFPSDYAKRGRFYVYYTDRQEKQRVVEYRRARADRANRSSARLVLRMDDPEANHNGGNLQFGPDKLLYIATGDGGGAGDRHGTRGNAQDLGSLLGKLLRIDPRKTGNRRYRIPSTNPFIGRAGARPEIYSYGLRNPWRFSFDRSTGALTIGDVGQSDVEEINYRPKWKGRGANFGWRVFEGSRRFAEGEEAPGAVRPVIEHTHGAGWCSITGGYVVRDRGLGSLRGTYLYGDFCLGRIYGAKLRSSRKVSTKRVAGLPRVPNLASFGEDSSGRIYVVSLNGAVWRLTRR
ncbi:sorbosone dehydrogenase family protein [Paraconexibacter sp.]|uniref:PQQ-dependent sugar dehydrogenase n=1 Tax=Paraconexibacter sp. TaxID=2949640 RepID=UPI003563C5D0